MCLSVSVVLATHNGAKYVSEQLDSIESQTEAPAELVVCDDASSDDTVKLVEAFASRSKIKVRLSRNTSCLGTGKTFEKALKMSHGEVVAFCDQDDVWLPQKLERLRRALDLNANVGYVISNARLVDEKLRDLGRTLWQMRGFSQELRRTYELGRESYVFQNVAVSTGMTTAIRRSVCQQIGSIPPQINHDMWYIPIAAAMGVRGALVPEPLSLYRQHSRQQFGVSSKFSLADARKRIGTTHRRLEKHLYYKTCMLERLSQMKCSDEAIIAYLRQEVKHFNRRLSIHQVTRREAVRLVLHELLDGNYAKFGSGLRSSFLDTLRILGA